MNYQILEILKYILVRVKFKHILTQDLSSEIEKTDSVVDFKYNLELESLIICLKKGDIK